MKSLQKWSFTFTLFWILIAAVSAYESYDNFDRHAEESSIVERDELKSDYDDKTVAISTVGSLSAETESPTTDTAFIDFFGAELTTDEPEDPLQKILPKVKFNCKGKSEGYYGDSDFCGVFHYCKTNGFRFTFICPKKSFFNDQTLACDFAENGKECAMSVNHNQHNDDNIRNVMNSDKSTNDISMILDNSGGSNERVEEHNNEHLSRDNKAISKTVQRDQLSEASSADPFLNKRKVQFGSRTKSVGNDNMNNDQEKKDNNNNAFVDKFNITVEVKGNNNSKSDEIENKEVNDHVNDTTSKLWHQLYENSFATSSSPSLALWSPLYKVNSFGFDNNNKQYSNVLQPTLAITTPLPLTTTSTKQPLSISPVKTQSKSTLPLPVMMIPNSKLKPSPSLTTTPLPFGLSKTLERSSFKTKKESPPNHYIPNQFNGRFSQQQNQHQQQTQQSSAFFHYPTNTPQFNTNSFQNQYQSNSFRNNHMPMRSQQKQYPRTLNHIHPSQSTIAGNSDNHKNHHFGLPQTAPTKFPSYLSSNLVHQQFRMPSYLNNKQLYKDAAENHPVTSMRFSGYQQKPLQTPSTTPAPSSYENRHKSLSELISALERIQRITEHMMQTEGPQLSQTVSAEPLSSGSNINQQQLGLKQQIEFENNSNFSEITMLSIPVLIPTGISKKLLKQSLTSSHLKPTVMPFTEKGQEIPAYVLQINSEESEINNQEPSDKLIKRRIKRQTYSLTNPYESEFLSSNYFPSFAATEYENGYFGNGMSLFDVNAPIGMAKRPQLYSRVKLAAQQNIPHYVYPDQQNNQNFVSPNVVYGNSPYDFSEFSDYGNFNRIPNHHNNAPPQRPNQGYDEPQYRLVSIRRPGFKRPPKRSKIPEFHIKEKENKQNDSNSNDKLITSAEKVEKITIVTPTQGPLTQPIGSAQQNVNYKNNPFSQLAEAELAQTPPHNLNEVITLFDNPNSQYIPIDSSLFESLFHTRHPQQHSHYGPPQQYHSNKEPVASALTGVINQNNNNNLNNHRFTPQTHSHPPNYLQGQFPMIPDFAIPGFRFPNIDVSGPELQNYVPRDFNRYNPTLYQSNNGIALNPSDLNESLRNNDKTNDYSSGFPIFNSHQSLVRPNSEKTDHNIKDKSNANPSQSENRDTLSPEKTHEIHRNPQSLFTTRSNWDSIILRHNKSKETTTVTPLQYLSKGNDKSNDKNKDKNDDKDNDNDNDTPKFGARLKWSQSEERKPTFSIKASVSSVSSMRSFTPQIIVGESNPNVNHAERYTHVKMDKANEPSEKFFQKDASDSYDERPKVNAHADRQSLLNYYNYYNNKQRILRNPYKDHESTATSTTTTSTTTSTTTTAKPTASKRLFRSWTGNYNSLTKNITTMTIPTLSPITKKPLLWDNDYDLQKIYTTTTSPPQTTLRTESPYRKVFSALQNGVIQTSKSNNNNGKIRLFGLKTKPNYAAYFSTLTSTQPSVTTVNQSQ